MRESAGTRKQIQILIQEVWCGPESLHVQQVVDVLSPIFCCCAVAQSCPTPWTAARQVSPSITISQSLLKPTSIESMMPSNHLILCRSLLLLPSIFPSIRGFSSESARHIRSQIDTVNSILDNYSYFLPSPPTFGSPQSTLSAGDLVSCFTEKMKAICGWNSTNSIPHPTPPSDSPALYLLRPLLCDQHPVKAVPLHPHIRSHSLS